MPASQRKTFPASSSNMLRKNLITVIHGTKTHGPWLMANSKNSECCTECHQAKQSDKKVMQIG